MKVKVSDPKVRGPSQLNEEVDPRFERVKAEIKAELMPKDRPKEKSRPRKSLSAGINDFC
jgi:hypothetical protein